MLRKCVQNALTAIVIVVASQWLQPQRAFRHQCTVRRQASSAIAIQRRITLQAHFRLDRTPIAIRLRTQLAHSAPVATILLQCVHLGQTSAMQNAIDNVSETRVHITMGYESARSGRMLIRKSGTPRIGERVTFHAAQRIVLNDGAGRVTAVHRTANAKLSNVIAVAAAKGLVSVGRASAVGSLSIYRK